jgi:hypothetical protein
MSASLMPIPRAQFFSANGVPLAGGKIYTYAAGSSTPQAAYTDSTGSVALSNPVVLDAGGFASIWLGASNYKITATDANGVTQWTVDNVSSVSLSELQSANTFTGLSVTGNASVTGNLTVDGKITAATGEYTGTLTVDGALTAASLAVTGNETVGGTLSVTGATSLGTLNAGATTVSGLTIGGTTLHDYIAALLPTLSAIAGTLIISNIATSGNWVVMTFGSTAGTRIQIAFGAGTITHGATIALPTGFLMAQTLTTVSINSVQASPGNNLDGITCSVSAGTVTAQGNDLSGHTYNGVANWMSVAWLTGI